jgi:hypothetical protein
LVCCSIALPDLPFIEPQAQPVPPQLFDQFARGGFVFLTVADEDVVFECFGHRVFLDYRVKFFNPRSG